MKTNKRFRIEITGSRGGWRTKFWIDNQGFTIAERPTKKEAQFMGRMLKIAFQKLQFKE